MQTTAMWIGAIFGPYLIFLGLWMTFCRDEMIKTFAAVRTNPGLSMIMAMISLLIGLVVINEFNVWVWQFALVVTLFGWYKLICGLMFLFTPHLLSNVTAKKQWVKIKGFILLLWGFLMSWQAFWMN